ncbi:signal transduction histidine kinase [Kribbella amoyensis]|uniref:histidine kinase n=2 Tax=Kribbella amoyensis TaxID=996641 RepID=A0A561BVI1_9ACTN|nr:signal transduction histidine kinase [Kribbella amoyensis]
MTRHGESGWLGRLLTSGVAVAVLATARPAEPWAWFVLAAGFAAFLIGTFLMTAREWWAFGLLGYAVVSSALIAGMPGSNALVLVLVSITDIAVMPFGRGRRNRPIIVAGVATALAYGGSALLFDRDLTWWLGQLGWAAVLIAFGLNRRQYEIQARQTEQLLAQTRVAQREHARAAALDERARIARELHDVLAHSLGALSVQLELAEALLEDRQDPAAALDRVQRSRKLARQGLTEARNAVAALRSDDVPALPEALATLAEQHRRDHGTTVRVTVDGAPGVLDSAAVVALLGAAREALTNAARHAAGRPVQVHLTGGTGVRLEVRNPIPEQPGDGGEAGFGLTGMRERLALVGGTLTAGPVGTEWVVVAEVTGERTTLVEVPG